MTLTEENYVDLAEEAIDELKKMKDKKEGDIPIVSTSKIRNLLAMTADIYNDVLNVRADKLPAEVVGRIRYLKIRFVYEAGRERSVRNLVEKAKILECLNKIGESKQRYILFSRYIEALVAFRKFKGGKDE